MSVLYWTEICPIGGSPELRFLLSNSFVRNSEIRLGRVVATAVAAAIRRGKQRQLTFRAACTDLRRKAPEFEIMKRSFAGGLLG